MIFTKAKLALVFGVLLITGNLAITQTANAVTGSDWRAGRIIDDAIFFNKDAITPQQIQAFLNARVPVCDRNNPYKGTVYGSYITAPYTCLKEYNENPTTKENNIGRFNANGTPYQVPGGQSAAQIIWNAGQAYGINPQALIVMLQKETAIVTDTWSAKWQYDRAMGYGCPDSGPGGSANCNTNYYGFYNQVSNAAWQLKRYGDAPDSYNFKAGVTRYIQYDVSTACGGTNVFIENRATAALYNYTPYQPNATALSNIYGGQDDGCSAYGNRNFWRLFNDWFGPTYGNVIRLNAPGSGIYLIENGVKRPFASAEAFLSHNYQWSNVVTVSDSVFNSFPTGPVIGLNLALYNGKVIKSSAPGSGIFLIENGIKRPFNSAEAFISHNYKWPSVITVSDSVFNSFPTGPVIGINLAAYYGKVIKSSAPGSGIFLIENGIKRPFNSAEAFISHNYKWPSVITVSDSVFNSFPTGPVINKL